MGFNSGFKGLILGHLHEEQAVSRRIESTSSILVPTMDEMKSTQVTLWRVQNQRKKTALYSKQTCNECSVILTGIANDQLIVYDK